MSKITTGLFFTALFLLCFFMLTQYSSARPEPAFHQESSPAASLHQDVEEDRCEGVGAEECLMRRTLAAHLDYIYTQKHNNP